MIRLVLGEADELLRRDDRAGSGYRRVAQSTYNSALMFALIFLILLVVLAIFWIAGRLEKYLLRWS